MKLTERVLMRTSKIMQRLRTKLRNNKEKREYYNGNGIFLQNICNIYVAIAFHKWRYDK